MITIPAGTRAYGMQLPIQAKSNTFVAEWERTATPADLARVARTADDHGFFYVGVCDHVAVPDSHIPAMGTFWADPIATLSWLAAHTTHTALLSHVYVLPYRHPLVAAKQFATLDHLSGGRAIAGIGAGHVQAEFELLGADFEHRGRVVEERLPVLMHALEDERVAEGFGASPRPVQTPRPPIWVAGSTPPAIRRAAKFGDGWLPQGPSNAEMVALLRQGLEKYGRADADLMIGHIAPFMYVGEPGWDVGEGVLTGSAQSIAEQTLAGTAEGVNQIQVRFKARTCDELCDQIAAFATEVAPLLQP